jgi:hypothetical protein
MRIGATRILVALVASVIGLLAWADSASAGQVLYAADGARKQPANLYVLDPSSGTVLQTVGPIGFSVTGLDLDPVTGTLYGTTGSGSRDPTVPSPGSLITIDRTTGAGSLVGDLRPDNETAADIAFTPDGTLYGWLEAGTNSLASIDKTTGAATVIGDSGITTFGSGIASNSTGVLFLAGEGESGPLRTVDRATGATTEVATLSGTGPIGPIAALAFDAAGDLFGARLTSDQDIAASDLIRINTGSGEITSLGPSVERLDAIAFAPKLGRSITLLRKLKNHGRAARLFGHVDAPGDEIGCQIEQTVRLQRLREGGKATGAAEFQPFREITTDEGGDYFVRARARKAYRYRAVLPETPVCEGQRSATRKVKAH